MSTFTRGAAPSGAPSVYPARTVLAVVCDVCGAGHSVTIADPDRSGAGWAAVPEHCLNGHVGGWRVMAVPGDGSRTVLSATWVAAPAATFPGGFNPFAPDDHGRSSRRRSRTRPATPSRPTTEHPRHPRFRVRSDRLYRRGGADERAR